MKSKFCPKCKSKDICLDASNAWAISIGASGWRCNNCGLELPEFPETEIRIKKRIKIK